MSQDLLVSEAGHVLSLALNRPSRKNALTGSLVFALTEELRKAAVREDLRAIVLTGEGTAFCSGADLGEIVAVAPSERDARLEEFHELIRAIVSSKIPTLAKVHGAAAGFGADLALACDFRVLSTVSFFQEAFVNIGLMPDGGATYFLPAMVGYSRAIEMLLLGERFDATELQEMGLAHRVVPVEALDATCDELVGRLVSAAPLSVVAIKRALMTSVESQLAAALAREKAGQLRLLASDDFAEGVLAFKEKRSALFKGR